MYAEFSLKLLDRRWRALSVQEEVHVIDGDPAQFSKFRTLVIEITGLAPRPDFGIDDLIDCEADERGKKLIVPGFFKRRSYSGKEFSFLGCRQAKIVRQKVCTDVGVHRFVSGKSVLTRFLSRLYKAAEKLSSG